MTARSTLARLACALSIAGLWAPSQAWAAAATSCTHTFPTGGGVYTQAVVDGDVLCGGPGRDRVRLMRGGTFRGRRGADRVETLRGGVFKGGRGADWVLGGLHAGRFEGGAGRDVVTLLHHGTFDGGGGDDTIAEMDGGTFDGGPDHDIVYAMYGDSVVGVGFDADVDETAVLVGGASVADHPS